MEYYVLNAINDFATCIIDEFCVLFIQNAQMWLSAYCVEL